MKKLSRDKDLYFENIGKDFDRWMSDYDVSRRKDQISRFLPEQVGHVVLEVGCGTGAISKLLSAHFDNSQLTVSDISERLARETGESLGCKWAAEDSLDLSFSDGSFSVVVSSECIEHTPNPASGVMEMMRVLKPGGTLILTTPNKLWWPVVRAAQVTHLRRFQGRENFLSRRQLHQVIERAGGAVIFDSGCHLFPWHIPFAKPILKFIDNKWSDVLYPLMINQVIVATKK